jgi:hypothetical protein
MVGVMCSFVQFETDAIVSDWVAVRSVRCLYVYQTVLASSLKE